MARTKTDETVKREMEESKLFAFLTDCLNQSDSMVSPFLTEKPVMESVEIVEDGNKTKVSRPKTNKTGNVVTEIVSVSIDSAIAQLLNIIGAAILWLNMDDSKNLVDSHAVKYAIIKLNDAGLQLRQMFDDEIDKVNSGKGLINKNIAGTTRIRKEREDKPVVSTEELTPQQVIAKRLEDLKLK